MSDDVRGGAGGLFPWFSKPKPASELQPTLFPEELPAVLARLRVSEDDLARWHEQRWVSFGPKRSEPLEPWDVHQIQFVRDVVRSGLSDAQIERLFSDLPRPMTFDPDAVAFSFSLGWVLARSAPEPDEVVEAHLDVWLKGLVEAGDKDRLIELRSRIDELLAQVEESS